MAQDVRVEDEDAINSIQGSGSDISYSERIDMLETDIRTMHEENDNLRMTRAKEKGDEANRLEKFDIMKAEYYANLKHMQSKLDDAYKLIARKESCMVEKNIQIQNLKTCVNEGSCKCIISCEHNCEMTVEINSLNEKIQILK